LVFVGSWGCETEEGLFEAGLRDGDVGDGMALGVERPDGGVRVCGAEERVSC